VHSIWSAGEVAANAHIYTEHYNGVSINYVFSTYPAQVLY